ncbi:MAG TPA: endolytic transglycosylase MltG [Bellilinea sp.]|nr:endolytic transglycosylase MltG [Bellilinea sp.]
MVQAKPRKFPLTCALLLILLCILAGGLFWLVQSIPAMAQEAFGAPDPGLGFVQRFQYSVQILLARNDLLLPVDEDGATQEFTISPAESVNSIGLRLEQAGLVNSAAAFRNYLIYSGQDTSLQAGDFGLSPAGNSLEIVKKLQDATPLEVTFVILPGWRAEEIAASLPTTGLIIAADDFLEAVRTPSAESLALLGIQTGSLEGFLYPGTYKLLRTTDLNSLLRVLILEFKAQLSTDLQAGIEQQGLTLEQAVTLASIVQREAMVSDEGPMIASVFYNRLAAGMKLDSDPTVQYAVGYNQSQATWWTNPLSFADLETISAYNTYQNFGLPPAPISNPGLTALQAVAAPADSPYFYFRARCDGSGKHVFAITFEEHLQNACP